MYCIRSPTGGKEEKHIKKGEKMKIDKKISNLFHKGLLFILSFILLVTTCFSGITAEERIQGGYGGEWTGPVTYADGVLDVDTSVGWFLGGSSYGQEGHMSINGKTAYCLERQKSYYSGMGYSDTGNDFSSLGISDEQAKRFSLIAYFAEQRAQSNIDWISVAQSLIWYEQGEGRGYVLSNSFPDKQALNTAMFALLDDVNNYYIRPSFHGTTQTVRVGEETRLTDTNGVLNTFEVYASDGLDVYIEGNDLVVTGVKDANDLSTITFIKKIAAKDTGLSILYDAGSDVQKIGSFYVEDPNSGYVKFNVEKYGALEITKTDRSNALLNGAVVNVKSTDGKYNQNHTVTNGKITISDLEPKEYLVKEVAAPNGYLLNVSEFKVTVEPNETAKVTIIDDVPTGTFTLTKKNADKTAALQGAQYRVWGNGYDKTLTTDANGKITITGLKLGTYQYQEVKAPNGYLLDSTISSFTLTYKDQNTSVVTQTAEKTNTEPTGKIMLNKKDAESGQTPQGDGNLAGAEYTLYANTDIYNKAGNKKYYSKDQVVAKRTTNTLGEMGDITNLPMGSYYLKETRSPTGYVQDQAIYPITLSYKDQSTNIITANQNLTDTVIKQAFSIIKISSDGSSGITPTLKGAEFTVKLKSDVTKNGWDTAKTFDLLVTDEKGYALSKELPYGTYVVKETKTPPDVYTARDFEVTINSDSRDPQVWRVVNDAPFQAYIKMIKKDSETGNVVALAGTKFKIKNVDTGEYLIQKIGIFDKVDTFETNDKGMASTPLLVNAGNYQLEEITAPNGYLLNTEPVPFKITNQGAVELDPDGDPVFKVELSDTPVSGQIIISKTGEVLTDYQDNQFIYEDRGLPGAKYNIIANEDIYSADHQTILYRKGNIIETIITGEDGKAVSSKLPLGKYQVQETEAPNGYLINKTIQDVELKYQDDQTELVSETVEFYNERQKVFVEVEKFDSEERISLAGAEISLIANRDVYNYEGNIIIEAGTVLSTIVTKTNGKVKFELDIPNDLTPQFGTMPLSEVEELDPEFSNTVIDGVKLIGDPNSLFLVKETKAPLGYSNMPVNYYVDTRYTHQNEEALNFSFDIYNDITKILFSKIDVTTGKELPGAKIKVYDSTGRLVKEFTSGEDPTEINGLLVGEEYTFVETLHPYGFDYSQEIKFVIQDTGEVQKIIMEDDLKVGRVEFNKMGNIYYQDNEITETEFGIAKKPVWKESNLLGSVITIYAAEDITLGNGVTYYQKDEQITTVESDWEAAYSELLLAGHYYAIETTTPHGYIEDAQRTYFEIKNDGSSDVEIIPITIFNERPEATLNFKKMLEQGLYFNDQAYQDVIFGVYARECIYDYMGNVTLEPDQLIQITGINKNGELLETIDLPNGQYYLKELKTHEDYELDQTEYNFSVEYQGKNTPQYTIEVNEGKELINNLIRTNVKIIKIDSDQSDKKLAGAEFALYDAALNKLETATTNEFGELCFEKLEHGKFYVQEIKAPEGYKRQAGYFEIVLDTKYDQDHYYELIIDNHKMPSMKVIVVDTGDKTNIIVNLVILGLSLVAIMKLKKKETDEEGS